MNTQCVANSNCWGDILLPN